MSEHLISLTFDMESDAYPLNEKIVLRSGVAVFESHLPSIPTSSPDCGFLSNIVFGNCFYGASDFPIYPFICAQKRPLTNLPNAAEVLAALHIANFQSEHITSLDSTQIAYPGYHPNTKNDEIHTDPDKQNMFCRTEDQDADDEGDSDSVSQNSHAALCSYVLNNHLFYILIHDKPKPYDEFMFSDLVLLFALGVSPATGNLVGAVTCQVCHNLCD